MKLIVITTEKIFDKEVEAVNLLFGNGMETLHLRKPYASQHETEDFIRQIKIDFHPRIVLHDYHDLAELFDLKGVHLNRRNQDIFQKKSVSRSCHSLLEVSKSMCYDYTFLSPVFNSISKAGYKQGFTPEELNEAKNRKIINERVVALGGITAENIPVAYSYGFGGVAVLGALWNDFAVDRNVNKLLERFNELKIKCNRI